MEVSYKNKKLKKQLDEGAPLERLHGALRAHKIRTRLMALRAAASLAAFWPPKSGQERCHELKGDRDGQLSLDLDHPYRLIFTPAHDPLPRRDDGGLDWTRVTAVIILGVEDTHE